MKNLAESTEKTRIQMIERTGYYINIRFTGVDSSAGSLETH